jgi:hypothetical protein
VGIGVIAVAFLNTVGTGGCGVILITRIGIVMRASTHIFLGFALKRQIKTM